jgi:hypothetical protein
MRQKKYDLQLRDEADDQALERLGSKQRLGILGWLWIPLVAGSALCGFVAGGPSLNRAVIGGAGGFLAYLAIRLVRGASNAYEACIALQYRTRLINQRLAEIEQKLDKL